ncbi:MAG: N-6 DNA methylase, partial [Armatimonadota bacterium]
MANHDWMALVDSSGLLVSEPVLREYFPDGPPPVAAWLRRRLATEWERFQLRPAEGQARWLDLVLEELTGIGRERWRKHPDIPEQTTHALAEYAQTLRPSRVLVDDEGEPLLLAWVAPPGQGLDTRESETGRWRASPATKLERLMRAVEVSLGLVTNGRHFRLIHAEGPSTSHITWDAPTWFDEPRTLDAFAMLLSAERFFGDESARLLALVQASQERQADVTDQLGEQVRTALDQFVRAVGRCDQAAAGAILAGMSLEAVYEMALVFLMRLVFLLYGEENHLLPHGEVLYDNSYGLTRLWTRLEREHHEDAPAMARRFDAFGQLRATFRLIHAGCTHPDLALRGYGGQMFDPERFPALEHPRLRISNATVHSLLRGLIFARGRVGRTVVNQRLSYRELDVEQLGSVYERLIDGMVRRAEEVMVTIDAGDQPVVALRELEARSGEELAAFLRSVSSMSAQKAERVAEADPLPLDQIEGAEWLDAETLARVAPYAQFLDVGATVLSGDLYVVQQSGARKAGGQYYTPRWITQFICERTLEPLVYQGEGEARRIKSPREILALNVCDPAMGSGAFLVQACRYLAERLVESWDLCAAEHPGERITIPAGLPQAQAPTARPLPEDHKKALIWARRYVADNCLYGVDVNPLAVEIAKMSLWLATLSKDRPFTFLDHKFKCGNSIIGAWASDIDRYPAAAWDRRADSGSPLAEALKQIRRQVRDELRAAGKRDARQLTFSATVPDVRGEAAAAMLDIERVDTLDPDEKERRYRALQANPRWQAVRRMYDAWCALWFWPLALPPAVPGRGSEPTSPPAPLRSGEGSKGTTTEAVPPSGTEGADRAPDAQRPREGGGGPTGRPASDLPLVWAWRELMQSLAPGAEAPVLTVATPERIARWEQTIADLREQIRFFHWELEFPDVFHERGGFDAIVFNPPYLDEPLPRLSSVRRLGECGNLFAYFIDLADAIANESGTFGCIVPMSAVSTERMAPLQSLLLDSGREVFVANFAWRPAKVFAEVNIPVSVIATRPGPSRVMSTTYNKWHSGEHNRMLAALTFAEATEFVQPGAIPKIGSDTERSILAKL